MILPTNFFNLVPLVFINFLALFLPLKDLQEPTN